MSKYGKTSYTEYYATLSPLKNSFMQRFVQWQGTYVQIQLNYIIQCSTRWIKCGTRIQSFELTVEFSWIGTEDLNWRIYSKASYEKPLMILSICEKPNELIVLMEAFVRLGIIHLGRKQNFLKNLYFLYFFLIRG